MSKQETTALARVQEVQALAGRTIRTPEELAERIRALQERVHLITPAVAVSTISDIVVINTTVVVVDPNGDEVYSGSFHKKRKTANGYEALEVSLKKTALLRILAAAGVTVRRSLRTDDGRTSRYWAWSTEGDVRDFDGTFRALPPGSVEIDLRDGSDQIGGWTPEAWAEREKAAQEKREKVASADAWKIKPEPINGWTADRVMQRRSVGVQLAESTSLTRLIRNLGLKHVYTKAELVKPFVCFRAMLNDRDPDVKASIIEGRTGASNLLFQSRRALVGDVIEVPPADPLAGIQVEEEAAPEPEPEPAPAPILITDMRRSRDNAGFVIKTEAHGDKKIHVKEEYAAEVAKAWKAKTPVVIEIEVIDDAMHLLSMTLVTDGQGSLLNGAEPKL